MKSSFCGVEWAFVADRRAARSDSEDGGAAGACAVSHQDAEANCPPSSNTGGTVQGPQSRSWKEEALAGGQRISLVLSDTGELKQLMVRRPVEGHCAFIDCLRLTVAEETWLATAAEGLFSDDDYIREASRWMEHIFGFGITEHLKRPRDFYLDSWVLGDGFGLVCFGGQSQRGTMLIVLHGNGCLAAKEGWERRLHDFLTSKAIRPVLTRVDLAHDCFHGDYVNVDIADQWFEEEGFTCAYRAPSHEYRGNWKRPDGKGRSLYIGKRKNGKLCRIYEKGREQGDEDSEWTRIEVEFRNTGRIIPLDVLLEPSTYFVGAYPCLQCLSVKQTPSRIACKTKSAEINVSACLQNIKRTYGKHLKVLRGVLGDEELLAKIESDSDEWPTRLKVPDYQWSDTPLHRLGRNQTRINEFDISNDGFSPPVSGSSGDFGTNCCH
ncbi:replication initiation factor domain-containing protein [Caballeronia sp. AZ7_KS35]|uniref:replication initiation factor domain-containing protein n=1 Tax=Caballeronia sp. AZ7_KS35 TaxID=2921762 RepID=UPI0020283AD2|nr:replication initiation factor domain-containing protein [Caballeronia sp. AZ7_KS35]